jgi:tetratricopeptide (TPR) repeat protein
MIIRQIRRDAPRIIAVVLLAACASATKRYEQGQQLEVQGRPADAAHRYIETLRKDPTYREARERLIDVGGAAVADYARQADGLTQAGAHMDAAEVLRNADALVREAASVNVTLHLPDAYSLQHSLTFSRAVEQALAQAAVATGRGNFAESLRLLERARERWEPTLIRQNDLDAALYDAQIGWSRSELASRRFRSAHEHAGAAALVPGADRRQTRALQDEALRLGTVLVAIFPAGGRSGTDTRVLPELNDVLVLEYWQRPPQWIDVINPIEAQRLVRNRGLSGRELSTQETSGLTRQLGAGIGVSLTVDSVRYTESKVERRRVTARTRAGKDTAYTVEEGELEQWARVAWREVSVNGGSDERGSVTGRGTTRFRRASYAGNWTDLDLKPADGALFDQRDPRASQDLMRQVARDLAEKLGREVYDAVLRRVE